MTTPNKLDGPLKAVLVLLVATLAAGASSASAAGLSGIWQATSSRTANRAGIPELTPRASADLEAFDPTEDPVIRCVMPGVPRSGLIVYPFEIVETETTVYFLYEHFGMVRRIHLDQTRPPEYFPAGKMGFSIGRWEDEVLVVESSHFEPGLLLGDGLRQYGDMHVVERYRLDDDGATLSGDVTITAPETFRSPWTRHFTWRRDPDGMIFEAVCDPADSRF